MFVLRNRLLRKIVTRPAVQVTQANEDLNHNRLKLFPDNRPKGWFYVQNSAHLLFQFA